MKIVKLIICILFGAMFINAGLNKFLNYMPVPELTEAQQKVFGAFMQITWLMPLIGIAEIVGGVLVIIPRTRALGALIIFPVLVGILLHHIVLDRSGLIMALVLMAINVWIIIDIGKSTNPWHGRNNILLAVPSPTDDKLRNPNKARSDPYSKTN